MLYFIFGLVVGSFLNVCIHRLPRGESVVLPGSSCPGCQHKLQVIDLIPVLSYLILKGRCRYCRQAISIRYPLVELLTGALFGAIALTFTQPLTIAFYWVFASLMIVTFFADWELQVIPDIINFMGIIFGLGFNLIRTMDTLSYEFFYSSLIGIVAGYLILSAVALLGRLAFKKEAVGEGDLFLVALLGAFLGWQLMLLALFLGYVVAGVCAISLLVRQKVNFGAYVPFGPALAVGGLISLFYGQQLIAWYLSLLI